MRKVILMVLIASTALLTSGCGRKGEKVLAKVNERVITLDEFNKKIEILPAHYQEIIKGQKRKYLDDIIGEELLYQEALRSNIDKDSETQEVIAEAKKKIVVSRLIKDRVNDRVSISDEELKEYYDKHSEEFMLPERWRASHILLDTRQKAGDVKARLAEGASFEELAKEKSKDATSKRGGDVGFFSKGQLIPEFEEACFPLEVGEVSDIVKTQFGHHVIMLTDKKSPEVQEFSDVKDLIKKEQEREQKKQLLEEMMNKLRREAKITVNEGLLEETVAEEEKE